MACIAEKTDKARVKRNRALTQFSIFSLLNKARFSCKGQRRIGNGGCSSGWPQQQYLHRLNWDGLSTCWLWNKNGQKQSWVWVQFGLRWFATQRKIPDEISFETPMGSQGRAGVKNSFWGQNEPKWKKYRHSVKYCTALFLWNLFTQKEPYPFWKYLRSNFYTLDCTKLEVGKVYPRLLIFKKGQKSWYLSID